jgi:hypothetical protein
MISASNQSSQVMLLKSMQRVAVQVILMYVKVSDNVLLSLESML